MSVGQVIMVTLNSPLQIIVGYRFYRGGEFSLSNDQDLINSSFDAALWSF